VSASGALPADPYIVAGELDSVVERWSHRANEARVASRKLEYWATPRPFDNTPVNDHLMRAAEDPDASNNPWVWPTPNSMREVEPSAYYVSWSAHAAAERGEVGTSKQNQKASLDASLPSARPRSRKHSKA
jgi:hypothetical protein